MLEGDAQLILRRANVSRKGGQWQHEDFDVFGGERESRPRLSGRCLRRKRNLVWGVSFQLTGRKSYGHAPTLDDAKAAFKAEYAAWRATQ
jgi:hypothetical protein